MQAPIEFIRSRKWPYVLKDNKIVLYKCPLCSSERTFQMHFISGRWICSACKEEGGLYDLKLKLGIIQPIDDILSAGRLNPLDSYHIGKIKAAHERLLSSDALKKELLENRPITEEAICYFELGFTSIEVDVEEESYLVFPHKFNGKYYNAKLRTWFGLPKKFQRIPGQPTIIYNADCLLQKPKAILLCEAEGDCVTAWSCGVKNVVSLTGGAKSTIPSFFLNLLEPVEKIIIAFDGDEAGREGARKMAKQLGVHRCYIVDFGDGLDLTDYVKLFGAKALKELLARAQPVSIGDIEPIGNVLDRMSVTPTTEELIPTGFPVLDSMIGGYDPNGFMITIAAPPKTCKTTFSCALAWNFALSYGPALVFCLEMNKERVTSIIASQFTYGRRRPYPVDSGILRMNLGDPPLYLAYMGNVSPEVVIETIREAFYRYGIRFVVFDNVHYLVRGVENKASKLADISKEFATLVRELGIIVILIAQPKKKERLKGQETEMTSADIAWTSALESDSDLIMIINRPRIYKGTQTFSPIFKITAESPRYASGGVGYFVLDGYSAAVFQVPRNYYREVDKFFGKLYKKED